MVIDPVVLTAPARSEPRVLRSDRRVVQSGRDRVREQNVAVIVLEQLAVGAVQHAWTAACEARGMIARTNPSPSGFNADQSNLRIVDKGVEDSHRVAAAADAGDNDVRQST